MNYHSPPSAATDLAVMIRGEKGSGKDVVAGELHRKSNRAAGPFVRVNSRALPQELVESELFGCAKGAFTGAVERPGKFELANGGTLFLDEVAELDRMAQPKLLHVTETLERGKTQSASCSFHVIMTPNG